MTSAALAVEMVHGRQLQLQLPGKTGMLRPSHIIHRNDKLTNSLWLIIFEHGRRMHMLTMIGVQSA